MAHQSVPRSIRCGASTEDKARMESRRPIPEPTYHWPGGPTADDDPTPVESALAALKLGAILAAAVTIAYFYVATYGGRTIGRLAASVTVLAAFLLPSVIAFLRTWRVRRRRGAREAASNDQPDA
jgi:drug/metabolite transporter (DMT)-like permease